jgi:asparagine synthase (glutamine-hydrolysing)
VTVTDDPVATTRHRVTQAVARQLVSDVPLGCFLSGGIDSSIVAAAMRAVTREAGQDVLTFSIGFDDARYDETPYAAEVARHLGTTHHEFKVRPDAAADLPKLAEVFGEPFGDSSALPTHYLSRETRRHVKVALSGDGGDELFGGYDRYRATRAAERAAALPAFVRPLLTTSLWQKVLPGNHPKSLPARIKRFQSSLALAPGPRYVGYMRLFDDGAAASLMSRRSATNYRGHLLASRAWLLDEYTRLSRGRDVVETATALDRVSYLPEDLLTKVDRASMLHALEVRSPFMDHELVAYASRLSTSQLIDGGSKRLLREAFAPDLPKAVFTRRKMGFAVPIGDWLRGELRPMLHDHLFARDAFAATHFSRDGLERFVNEHERGTADHSQRLYALLMLELWWRTQKA